MHICRGNAREVDMRKQWMLSSSSDKTGNESFMLLNLGDKTEQTRDLIVSSMYMKVSSYELSIFLQVG